MWYSRTSIPSTTSQPAVTSEPGRSTTPVSIARTGTADDRGGGTGPRSQRNVLQHRVGARIVRCASQAHHAATVGNLGLSGLPSGGWSTGDTRRRPTLVAKHGQLPVAITANRSGRRTGRRSGADLTAVEVAHRTRSATLDVDGQRGYRQHQCFAAGAQCGIRQRRYWACANLSRIAFAGEGADHRTPDSWDRASPG